MSILPFDLSSLSPEQASEERKLLYRKVRKISHGTYGSVSEVEVTRTFTNGHFTFMEGTRLARKKPRYTIYGEIVEIDILNRIHHPNVVNAYDTYIIYRFAEKECYSVNLILPLSEYSLHELIKERITDFNKHSDETILKLMYEMLCGLSYLHSNNIVHDDLKPNNILIFINPENNELVSKIADFGTSSIITSDRGVETQSQTLWWRPPELLEMVTEIGGETHRRRHSYKSDIWAMGVIFLELITGNTLSEFRDSRDGPEGRFYERPTGMVQQLEVIRGFLNNKEWRKNSKFKGVLFEAQELLYYMLGKSPRVRITAKASLNDRIFSHFKCEIEKTEKIAWMMEPGLDLKVRREALNELYKIGWEPTILFLSIDIADRYYAVKKGTYQDMNDIYLTLLSAILIANNLIGNMKIDEDDFVLMDLGPIFSSVSLLWMDEKICDILQSLEWKLYRPTLIVENPSLDLKELFKYYLEGPVSEP